MDPKQIWMSLGSVLDWRYMQKKYLLVVKSYKTIDFNVSV
jgi:hypothetical protein